MKAVDTSVIIAGFASWHESHTLARRVLDDSPALIAHCALETYSVLTRLPVPHRSPPQVVAKFLAERFRAAPLSLPPAAHLKLVSRLAAAGIVGGAVYDALVAATAVHHKAQLVTLDERASDTYERLGVDVIRLT